MPGPDTLRDFRRIQDNVVIDDDGCWIWQGSTKGDGYGKCGYKGRTGVGAHRMSYEVFVGPIPPDLHLDHLCRKRPCVNPDHLEPVTVAENLRRSEVCASTVNSIKTHCPERHPYDEVNTYIKPDGSRGCRTCIRAAGRRHDAKRRGRKCP